MQPIKVDYIFRNISYKKGERNKNVPDEDEERYISRLHWGASGANGCNQNYMWLNDKLGLSIKMGQNPDANNKRRRKSFQSLVFLVSYGRKLLFNTLFLTYSAHTGKRSAMKRVEFHGSDIDEGTKMILSSHKTE